MTLDELLLQNLAKWRPHSPRQTLDVTHDASGWTASATADTVDSVGARLWEVRLTRNTPLAAPPDLKDWANQAAARITGLLEPLQLIEVGETAQLRSASPTRRGDALAYYELLRHPDGTTSVRRYQACRTGGKREQIAFSLTHEALAKLAADLAS